jgi:alpha-ketoglutarate-dependent taurine dioxygenase
MVHIIDFKNLGDICDNIDEYANKFLEDGIIVFRNANLSEEDQGYVQEVFGSKLNLWPRLLSSRKNIYDEGHLERAAKGFGGDEIMLPWHIEHPQYVNPICAGFWNMYKFDTDTENGKTYFYNMGKFYETLTEREKLFASRCRVYQDTLGEYPLIGEHWYKKNFVVRSTGGGRLSQYKDEIPHKRHVEEYEKLLRKIKESLDSEENRVVLKWQKGDLAVVDIYSMAHAVTGGFLPGERKFIGLWSFKDNNPEINKQ